MVVASLAQERSPQPTQAALLPALAPNLGRLPGVQYFPDIDSGGYLPNLQTARKSCVGPPVAHFTGFPKLLLAFGSGTAFLATYLRLYGMIRRKWG